MKRFEIYLPLFYPDDTRIEEQKFNLTRKELLNKFGGLTVLPAPPSAVLGFWTSEDHTHLSRENPDLQEATQLFKLLLDKSQK